MGAQLTTPDAVQQALAGVSDPLLGQNLVDLGMVQQVRVARGGHVMVRLALPSPHWPATQELILRVQAAVASLAGVVAVDVQPVDDPAWTPYRMSPALKTPLGLPDQPPPSPFFPPPALLRRRIRQRLRRLAG